MQTSHIVSYLDARDLSHLDDDSVALIVTSPPYPMIEMWDAAFGSLSLDASKAFECHDGKTAFEACHRVLDATWRECLRVLIHGGFACVNIGDATRTIAGFFQIYSNHARIIHAMSRIGFTPLPDILWRKQTNAPNRFMGSGMLPAGAYATYEHEYLLIFRKGGKRCFSDQESKLIRRKSAFFWEERNVWFSDVWTDLRGASQSLCDSADRSRSAAFPFELAYRLINMYSVIGDSVLDPFAGTGTTAAAAIVSGRNSHSIEIDQSLSEAIESTLLSAPAVGSLRIRERLANHQRFVESRIEEGRPPKHQNRHYGFPVVTAQERDLELWKPEKVMHVGPNRYEAHHCVCPLGNDASSRQLSLPF